MCLCSWDWNDLELMGPSTEKRDCCEEDCEGDGDEDE